MPEGERGTDERRGSRSDRELLLRCLWRLDSLDQWREGLDRRVAVIESDVNTEKEHRILRDALDAQRSEAIANQVSTNLQQHGLRQTLDLTWWQKAGAFLAGALILADSVRGLFGA